MKNQLFTLLLLILLISVTKNLPAQITFQKGDASFTGFPFFKTIRQTSDGGYILLKQGGVTALQIAKADANGNNLWRKFFAGPNNATFGNSIQQTSDGGYIATGVEGYLSGGSITNDVFVVRTDANGDSLWVKRYGGTGNDFGNSIQQTTDGGFIITGETIIAGDTNVYVIKTDAGGGLLWSKSYGGSGRDIGYAIEQTTDGGYIIAGITSSFGAGNADIYLIKTNATGDTLWSKTFGGMSADIAHSVQQTSDGGYIIAGETFSFGAGSIDAYLIKADGNGALLWSKSYGGSGFDRARSVQQTSDGGYIFTGQTTSFGSGVYLIKTDSNGDTLWTKTVGEGGYSGYSIDQTSDGGYVIGGNGSNVILAGVGPYFIKTDSTGNSGCEATTNTIVTIPATIQTSPATIVTSPATITTNPSAGITSANYNYTTLCTTIGINDIENETGFAVYPNPATNKFKVQSLKFKVGDVLKILDSLGKEILNLKIIDTEIEIDVSNFEQGIYFVQIVSADANQKIITTKKLIIN